jgi:hypothetical protein
VTEPSQPTAVLPTGVAFVGCTLAAATAVVGWWIITGLITGRLVIVLAVGLALPASVLVWYGRRLFLRGHVARAAGLWMGTSAACLFAGLFSILVAGLTSMD